MLAAMRRAAAAAAAAAPARAAAARAAAAAAARRLARFDPADADDPAGDATRPTTPWARQVISGVDLLRNAKFSKGLAFSPDERERLYLRGLLPPAVLSQATQAERVLANLRGLPGDVAKVGYLLSLQERNERLFYWVLRHHAAEAAPLLQHPAIGAYCAQYSLMFRSTPRGLYLALADKGHVFSILKNWPERRVKAICLTDGAAVGTQGDLGVQAACAPIARLAMLTAVGGVDPSTCLPVTLDAGTDNERLLADPIYVGERHRRVGGEPFEELVEELLRAVRARFGPSVLVDLQHMAWETSSRLLATYRGEFPMYSDGHHGLPALALAAVLAAGAGPLAAHRFVLVGDGPGVAAVAEVLEEAAQREARGGTVLEARGAIHLVDRAGLATRARADAGELADHQLPYIQDAPACPDLAAAVAHIKPTVIIGVSDGAPPFAFSQEVCAAAAAGAERPVMLALSLRGADGVDGGAEGAAADVARWTGGAARFASRAEAGPLLDVLAAGVALGTLMSRSTRLPEVMFVEAARAVARCISAEDRAAGRLLPRAADGRDVAAAVAVAIAERAYASGVATELPKPHALAALAERYMYDPTYRRYK